MEGAYFRIKSIASIRFQFFLIKYRIDSPTTPNFTLYFKEPTLNEMKISKYSSNTKLSFLMGSFFAVLRSKKTHLARLYSFFGPRSVNKSPRSKKQSNIARKLHYSHLILFLAISLSWGCEKEQDTSDVEMAASQQTDVFFEQAVVGPQDDGTFVVATTQRIDPAGTTIQFPGRPTDLVLNPDQTLLAVKNKNDLVLMDVATKSIRQTLALNSGGHTFAGIEWSEDGKKVWMTDTRGHLRSAALQEDGRFAWTDEFLLPGPSEEDKNPYPGGLAIDGTQELVYVTLSRNNTLGVVNLETGAIETQIPVGIAPYTVLLHQNKAYVSNWGGRRAEEDEVTGPSSGSRVVVDPETGVASTGTVSVIDLSTRAVIHTIEVLLHPSDMVFSPDGSRLYVANANSDAISVIDTEKDVVINTLNSKPMPELPFGSMPNALAVSPDGQTLYVANGGNNLLATIDLKTDKITGLIPTGWYPGAITLSDDGQSIIVANTKGIGSRDTARVLNRENGGFNSHDHTGSVTFIDAPSPDQLEEYTIRAASNMRLPKINQTMQLSQVEEKIVPVPTSPGEKSVFKHVIYIIKENRTYDQIFGDMPQGNGDATLCQFGREVTPNHHALAERYVLLDNTYCNGILSADGHQWTNEGVVTDYIEKSFGGFVRSYPYDGDDALAYASSGFIWDYVLKAGLTFRNYGEFVKAQIEPQNASWTDIYNDYLNNTNYVSIRATTELHTLEPYIAPSYVGFPGSVPDVYRAREFIKELNEFEKRGNLPNFIIMLLPNDHTVGTREGFPTPRATVADNDLALGQIVEAVSKSQFWKETAIFVIQDDPQAGLDHVDGRRTVALCISPYTKRGEVISKHYNQNSFLRTMELILGLPPMTQFDMAATSMEYCFTNEADFTPYTALPNQIPLDEMNAKLSMITGKQLYYAQQSMEMPLDDIDQADEEIFNRIIWHSVKGYDTPYPVLDSGDEDLVEEK